LSSHSFLQDDHYVRRSTHVDTNKHIFELKKTIYGSRTQGGNMEVKAKEI